MKAFMTTLNQLQEWVHQLSGESDVYFPKKTGETGFSFELIHEREDIQFSSYLPTTLPPVKLLLPAHEELLTYRTDTEGNTDIHVELDRKPRIIASVRPCDLKGIFLMDQFFSDGVKDPYYGARREMTTIIGYACSTPCDDHCFCAAVDSLSHTQGADLMIYEIDEMFMIEAQTTRGEVLLGSPDWEEIHDAAARKVGFQVKRPEPFGRSLEAPIETLPETVRTHWKSSVWDKHVERCFSCGTCNLVCPTCYCFDVTDDVNLDVVSGSRTRTWDACMLPGFAGVAGGHNFRPDPAGRQRHRVKKKFEYLPMRFGHGSSCVGCGRCGRQCTSGIDIFDIVQDLITEGVEV